MAGNTGKLRIVVASHSLVAERQQRFWDYFHNNTDDVEVLQVAPKIWGVHRRQDGYSTILDLTHQSPEYRHRYSVGSPGYLTSNVEIPDLLNFTFGPEALIAIEHFKPDIIYVQNEAYCQVTHQLQRIAKRMGCKFVMFAWENLQEYLMIHDQKLLENCDLIICGNGDAEDLVKPFNTNTLRCIQVGVDTDMFQGHTDLPEYNVIFQGRMTKEKGVDVLKKAAEGMDWKILWPEPNFRTSYSEMPKRYGNAHVHASPSIDSTSWAEQHASYANLEALSCGNFIATSNSNSIYEALKYCPYVKFSNQNDPENLKEDIVELLSEDFPNKQGREWVKINHGNEAVSERLLKAFWKLM